MKLFKIIAPFIFLASSYSPVLAQKNNKPHSTQLQKRMDIYPTRILDTPFPDNKNAKIILKFVNSHYGWKANQLAFTSDTEIEPVINISPFKKDTCDLIIKTNINNPTVFWTIQIKRQYIESDKEINTIVKYYFTQDVVLNSVEFDYQDSAGKSMNIYKNFFDPYQDDPINKSSEELLREFFLKETKAIKEARAGKLSNNWFNL